MSDIRNIFTEKFSSGQVLFNEPMKYHTSFKIGGNADIFVMPSDIEELIFAVEECRKNNVDYYIIGNGTNLLVTDKGFKGVIIQIYRNMSKITSEDNTIIAQAGALLSATANTALKNNLSGFEFASGIPGTIGGAVCMNAGAYGGEMKDVVKCVKVFDGENVVILNNEEAGFEYRNSNIIKKNMVVLEAVIDLNPGVYEDIKLKMKELNKQRSDKQPLELPSAGSTFKRPEGYFAGKLIMDAGLKGYAVGGACVSEKHCGFVVNNGNATSDDVINLINHVQKTVFDKFGVMLETEVKIIGER